MMLSLVGVGKNGLATFPHPDHHLHRVDQGMERMGPGIF